MHQKSWRQFWPSQIAVVAIPWKKVSSSTIRTSKATKYFQRHSYHHPVYYCPAKISILNDFSSATQLWMNDVVIPSITVFKNSLKKSHLSTFIFQEKVEKQWFCQSKHWSETFSRIFIHCVVRFLLWFFLRSTCSFQTKQVLSSFSTPMLATLLSYSNWMTRNENFVYYYNFFSGAPSLIFSCFPSKSKLRKNSPNFSFPAFHV